MQFKKERIQKQMEGTECSEIKITKKLKKSKENERK
jgi:hypothetical protein